ncbi:MAG: hypothetical protein RMH75_04895 [Archaeoglobaceae archaeon]|nr:hypothetical protein [Archaeoglobaceae archaeon]MDW7989982.1 hypothetical protein [Archaeoglobaceae archaeon]
MQRIKELDFKARKEDWMNVFLEDGTVIRFKSILTRVFDTGQRDVLSEPIYRIDSQNVVVARAPDELKGQPSEFVPPIQEIVKKRRPTIVRIKALVGDDWNEYELEDGSIIKTRTVITKVLRLDGYFDSYGNPVYVVQSQMIVAT